MSKRFGLLAFCSTLTLGIAVAGCSLSAEAPTTAQSGDRHRAVVEAFIKADATYAFDGVEGSIKFVKTDPGWSSAFKSIAYTYDYQTSHPGHGDRTGKMLAQAIADHTAVVLVNSETGTIALAICDKTWDMVNDKSPLSSVTGTVVSGGDTTEANGPLDAPRVFIYKVRKSDGTFVSVSYVSYPPSPAGNAAREKIVLEFNGGQVSAGDTLEALGRLDKETNTIVVAEQGDYIKTYAAQP